MDEFQVHKHVVTKLGGGEGRNFAFDEKTWCDNQDVLGGCLK